MEHLNIYENINDDFSKFLRNDNNDRILFSAKFGTGKTTFINQFFEDNEEYNTFHLFPVNYSVAENTDIFRLIKYDIIYYLLVKYNISFSDSKIKPVDYLPSFIKSSAYKLLLPLLTFQDPSLGPMVYKELNKEIEKFTASFNQLDESKSDLNKIDEFALAIFEQDGSIYEKNYTTDLVKQALLDIKGTDGSKKNVLIIDDLDRLDPAHIFRLFNVFAAHFDMPELKSKVYGNNKYGFDKIIFVCDVNNIHLIYKHIYGDKTDFTGYIDKFFSTRIYYYDTNKNITKIISDIIENHIIEIDNFSINDSSSGRELHVDEKDFLTYILTQFFINRKVTIRSLTKYGETLYVIKRKELEYSRNFKGYYNYQIKSLMIVEYLRLIVGDINMLKEILYELKDKKTDLPRGLEYSFFQIFSIVLFEPQHKFERGKIDINLSKEWGIESPMKLTMEGVFGDGEGEVYYACSYGANYGKVTRFFNSLYKTVLTYEKLEFLI